MKTTTRIITALAALGASAVPALAQEGDPAAGEQVFNKCAACHVAVDEEGNTLAGRNGRVGPNLYGVAGRQAGTVEDFRYSTSMVEAGEAGLVWGPETIVPYLLGPTPYLQEYLDDKSARGKMAFMLRDEQEARDVFAYLASLTEEGSGTGPGVHPGS